MSAMRQWRCSLWLALSLILACGPALAPAAPSALPPTAGTGAASAPPTTAGLGSPPLPAAPPAEPTVLKVTDL
jgi:hypothetical protein